MSHNETPQPASQPDDLPQGEPREFNSLEDATAAEGGKFADDDLGIDVESVANHLAADLGRLQTELEEAQNRALRSSAELENFRRRSNRQLSEERRYANLDLFRELLPIWDNMGRAVEAAQKAGETGSLLEGFKLVYAQLESMLERFHCVKIEAEGQAFDPNRHEAISQMPSPAHPAGTVLYVTQVGFMLHDRVVRPSQVVVSTLPPGAEQRDPDGVKGGEKEETTGNDLPGEEQE